MEGETEVDGGREEEVITSSPVGGAPGDGECEILGEVSLAGVTLSWLLILSLSEEEGVWPYRGVSESQYMSSC